MLQYYFSLRQFQLIKMELFRTYILRITRLMYTGGLIIELCQTGTGGCLLEASSKE